MELSECSLNSATIRGSSLDDVLGLAVRYGFGGVGLWRDVLDDADLVAARARADDAGLRVTSVCRGGMFPQPTESLRRARLDDNRRAVDQARALCADCLVLVCGPPLAGDLASARGRIREGIEQLIPYAVEAGVALAVEPFHPMLAATRSAITSLREAAALTEGIGHPQVGLALDSYHVWWETDLREQIIGAGDRIMSVQLADWCTPIDDELTSRGMPGEGDIDMAGFVTDCRSAGYSGLVEVEVLSSRWWSRPAELTVAAAAAALGAIANPLPSS